jgi:protein involved in polysaccharide export with SLBB domain
MRLIRLVVVVALMIGLAPPAGGQEVSTRDPQRTYVSRAQLTSLLEFYQRSMASTAYSETLRDRARYEAEAVRSRLEQGDFQVGDRVVLLVEGQEALSDTFLVASGQIIRFPELGEVQLQGVLRSELQTQLANHFVRFVRDVRLESHSLIRIQLDGAVSRPGFHLLPSETPLPDAIMFAGGPVGEANLDGIRIERGGRRVVSREAVQQGLAQGRTLDELSLRGGDRIFVPRRATLGGSEGALRTVSLLLALPLSAIALISIF